MKDKRWYVRGIQFECQGCAECCKTHGEYAYVYVTPHDIEAISQHLGITPEQFLSDYCQQDDARWVYFTTDVVDCPFLDGDENCKIYPVRPKQCSTWPFWTDNLERANWEGPVSACCPGIGKGKTYSADEIDAIAREKDRWYW